MGYEFPLRKSAASDIASPIPLNEELTMIADRINLVDGHNINSASFSANVVPATNAFGKRYAAHVGSDPSFKVSSAVYQYPNASASNVFTLEEHGRWQEVTGATVTTDTTGLSTIKAESHVQYIWHGWTGTSLIDEYDHIAYGTTVNSFRSIPVSIQFALRIDGVVVDDSITGHIKLNRTDFYPIKAIPERSQAPLLAGLSPTQPGPLQPKTQRIAGLGPQCMAVVVQAAIQVEPGPHTVTLVVRRLISSDVSQRVESSVSDVVSVYNRTLVVDEAPFLPQITYSSSGISVPEFQNEDVLSQTTMYTNRVQPVLTALNDLRTYHIRPYSLRYEHLPQILISTARFETGQSPNVVTTTNWFDGETGAIAGATSGSTGWTLLHDGAGTEFKTSITTNVTSQASFIRIRGHVQISYIIDSAETHAGASGYFVAVALGYKMNGVWNIITRSISYLNSWNVITDSDGKTAEETQVPLLSYLDYRSSLPSYNISAFGIFAAVFSNANYDGGVNWARVKVGWRQAGLFVYQYRN
jgi:hypothetical protein